MNVNLYTCFVPFKCLLDTPPVAPYYMIRYWIFKKKMDFINKKNNFEKFGSFKSFENCIHIYEIMKLFYAEKTEEEKLFQCRSIDT
jgi:hypothetical protein